MTALIFYFAFTVLVSFVCSVLEAVILSVPYGYASSLAREGSKAGMLLMKLKRDINRPLSAILTLNTIANTAGASLVGAQAKVAFEGHSNAVQIVSFIIPATLTFSVLTFSEIIPKTLGAAYCKPLAPAATYVIRGLIVIIYPLVIAFEWLTKVMRPSGEQVTVSREELLAQTRLGVTEGTLGPREARTIENLMALKDILVADVMTPRAVMLSFAKTLSVREVIKEHPPLRYSRLPIYGEDMDDITGVVLRYDILKAYTNEQKEIELNRFAKPIHVVPETMSVSRVLEEFIKRRDHIFLVVDEYGGTAGIITLEDAIETLLGVEIVDEFDTVADLRKFAREQFSRRHRGPNVLTSDEEESVSE